MVHSCGLIDPTGFQMALQDCPVVMTGAPVDAPVYLWNHEIPWAIDMITLRYPPHPGWLFEPLFTGLKGLLKKREFKESSASTSTSCFTFKRSTTVIFR